MQRFSGSWRSAGMAVGVSLLIFGLGCAGARPETELPPQSLAVERPAQAPTPPADVAPLEPAPAEPAGAEVAPEPAPARPPAQPAVAAPPSAPAKDESLVVIDKSDATGREDQAALLRDLSRSERDRRQKAPPSRLVLTDDNLAAHAEGARVTFSSVGDSATPESGAAPAAPSTTSSPAAAGATEPAADLDEQSAEERYWRSRALEVRQRWRQSYDDVPRLQSEVDRLRTAFYAEDDPARRDRQIKPLWDRALDRLQETRSEVERAREELEVLLAEGTAAGALPGWLREGSELEPPDAPLDEPGESIEEADPDEPVTVKPESHEPPGT